MEESNLLMVIGFSMLGGVVSLAGGAFLLGRKGSAKLLADYATPFAAGALLAAAFYDLLKEAIHESGLDGAEGVLLACLGGLLFFFFLERFVRWFHHHHEHGSEETTPSSLIIIGDTLHNALDGVAIAAAFLISPSTGVIVTLAVAAHEIPQEIGDFGLLLKNGMRRGKVLLVNLFSALATVLTATVVYLLGSDSNLPLPLLLGITAGFFIYIAASDIIPEIHQAPFKAKDIRPFLLLLGILTVIGLTKLAHNIIDVETGHSHGKSESSSVEAVHEDEHGHGSGAEDHEDGHDH